MTQKGVERCGPAHTYLRRPTDSRPWDVVPDEKAAITMKPLAIDHLTRSRHTPRSSSEAGRRTSAFLNLRPPQRRSYCQV